MQTQMIDSGNKTDSLVVSTELRKFIPRSQMLALSIGCLGEEKDAFCEILGRVIDTLGTMPVTYGQDGKGMDSIAYLHYFTGGCDWYITEKDMYGGVQQAYGYAVLNGDYQMAEFGYISIIELLQVGAELDLHFEPKALKELIPH